MNPRKIPMGKLPFDLSKTGNFFCKLKIGNAEIAPHAINSLVIREWIFDMLPRLELMLQDDGSLVEAFTIKDQTEIYIEIGKLSEKAPHIIANFLVDTFTIDQLTNNGSFVITISAILKTSGIFSPIYTRSFKKKTSIDVLRQIGNEIGLIPKVAQNLITSDNMTWYQINTNNFDFIKHIKNRAYIPDDVLLCYADILGNLNMTSIKTEFEKNKSITARYNIIKTSQEEFEDKADEKIIWFNGYRIENIQGYYNKTCGNGLEYSYYDLNKVQQLNYVSNYYPYVSFSGQPQNGQLADSINYGILTDNVFPDYFKAKIQKEVIKANTFSQRIAISINSIYDIKLMDKIDIQLPSIINANEINSVYSGEYLCSGIIHSISRGGIFLKEISLHRNGYNKSSFKV